LSMELVHTSAPRGLRSGARGFCTVAATQGMPTDLMDRLESMSGFKQALDAADPRPRAVFSHVVLSVGGVPMQLLSRIGPAPADYSGRTNRIAHHVMLSESERPTAGPAAVLSAEGIFEEHWSGEPRTINRRLKVDLEPVLPRPCEAWAALCGDAGWAGRVLEAVFDRGPGPLYVLVPSSADPLVLMSEVVALLPEARRWEATFTSLFQGDASPDVRCKIRFVPGTPEGQRLVRASFGAQSLDLSAVTGLPPPTGPAAEAARAGTAYGPPQPAGPRRLAPPAPLVVDPPARSLLVVGDPDESEMRPRKRSLQPIEQPRSSLGRLLLAGTGVLIVGVVAGVLLMVVAGSRFDNTELAPSQQTAPKNSATAAKPATPVPAGTVALARPAATPVAATAELPSAPVDAEKDRLTARVGELEKQLQDAVTERDLARTERDQHKSEAETARQALKESPKALPPVPPQFAMKSGEGLEAVPETEIDSYTVSGKQDMPVDTNAFSLTGTLRYSLAKETVDRVRNLKLVGDAGRIRVCTTPSAVSGTERTIGWFSLVSGPDGVTSLVWKRDDSDPAKHENFVLVLRNEQEQILKIKVKCPEK
jgi:hypothetical protein